MNTATEQRLRQQLNPLGTIMGDHIQDAMRYGQSTIQNSFAVPPPDPRAKPHSFDPSKLGQVEQITWMLEPNLRPQLEREWYEKQRAKDQQRAARPVSDNERRSTHLRLYPKQIIGRMIGNDLMLQIPTNELDKVAQGWAEQYFEQYPL